MYQFSRAMYRDLAPLIAAEAPPCLRAANPHAAVLQACEATLERMASDRHYFKKPARTLFTDVRVYFPISAQARVCAIVRHYVARADAFLATQPQQGVDLNGNPLQCRATTRKGTACQRMPLAQNGYCPSHQHLAETEDAEEAIAA